MREEDQIHFMCEEDQINLLNSEDNPRLENGALKTIKSVQITQIGERGP